MISLLTSSRHRTVGSSQAAMPKGTCSGEGADYELDVSTTYPACIKASGAPSQLI